MPVLMDGMPWDAVSDAVETIAQAARRHGRSAVWMRRRAVRAGVLQPQPVGRPKGGTGVTLPVATWDAVAAPKVRRFVSVASLVPVTGREARTIVARCHAMKERVYVDVPDHPWKYSVSASTAARVTAAFRSDDAARKGRVSLKHAAGVCGYYRDAMRRMLTEGGFSIVVTGDAGGRRSSWVLMDDAVSVTLSAKTREKPTRDRRKAPPVAGRETTATAVRRTGVPLSTLRRWLVADGVAFDRHGRRKAHLNPAVVDRVVAENRARSVNARRARDVG